MTCIVINRDSNGSTVDTSELDDLNMNQKIQFLIELFESLHDELHTQVEELEERMEDFEIAQEKVKDLYESLEGGGVSLCEIGEILNWAITRSHVRRRYLIDRYPNSNPANRKRVFLLCSQSNPPIGGFFYVLIMCIMRPQLN